MKEKVKEELSGKNTTSIKKVVSNINITIPNVKTMFTNMIVTANREQSKTGALIIVDQVSQKKILSRQTVVVAGPNSSAKVGEEIELNVDLFPKRKINAKNDIGPDSYIIVPPLEEIEGKLYLLISDREIKYIYE